MSLLCVEKLRDIEYGDPLKAGTRKGANFYSAIGPEAIDQIPVKARRKTPCRSRYWGVNIHEASSSNNFNGSYTICDFTLGKFLFSLSQKNAEKYLPNLMKQFLLG